MSSVIVNTTGFPRAFSVVYWNNETGDKDKEIFVNEDSLAEFLAADDNVEEVSLFGLQSYNEGLKEEIEKLLAADYSNHNMKIEVM